MILQETMSSEEIYEDLCNKIEKLVYLPGYKISENELCKQYGVSRHIIRDRHQPVKGTDTSDCVSPEGDICEPD